MYAWAYTYCYLVLGLRDAASFSLNKTSQVLASALDKSELTCQLVKSQFYSSFTLFLSGY